ASELFAALDTVREGLHELGPNPLEELLLEGLELLIVAAITGCRELVQLLTELTKQIVHVVSHGCVVWFRVRPLATKGLDACAAVKVDRCAQRSAVGSRRMDLEGGDRRVQ